MQWSKKKNKKKNPSTYLKHILYLVNSSKVVIMDTSADQIVVLLIMQFSPLNLFLITGEEADNKMQNDSLKNSILVNSRVNEDNARSYPLVHIILSALIPSAKTSFSQWDKYSR